MPAEDPTKAETRGRKSRAAIHRQLQHGVDELRERFGGLPNPVEAERIWGDIWFQEAHNSTAIEGNTLALKQVQELLTEGRAVGGKPVAEYLEVTGYAEAARWVYGQALELDSAADAALLTMTEVRHIHRLVVDQVWRLEPHPGATPEEGPGNFRVHDIRPFASGMRPVAWTEIHPMMSDWLVEVNRLGAEQRLEFPDALAVLHASFERIHPFLDGNGRTGRLLTNLILIRLGYPPALIRNRARNRYLRALARADGGDPAALGELLARGVLDTLNRFIVPAVAGPAKLVPLLSLVDDELTGLALKQAAARGRLRTAKDGQGRLQSTRQWVEEYKASRSKRGRPGKGG